jgi:hypothetical protein
MISSSLHHGSWDSIIRRLGEVAELEASARLHKAFQRRGKVADAVGLLRLALMYGPGRLSLRGTAAAACGVVADMSDKAVEGRLRKAGDWLQYLLECLLRAQARLRPEGALALSLVDGSLISAPGSGGQWRLHASYDPGAGRFTDLCLTPVSVSEAANRTRLAGDDLLIMDRGYARVRNFTAVLASGGAFITRLGWRSLALKTEAGTAFDIIQSLPDGAQPIEHSVRVGGVDQTLRLVIQRLPGETLARSQRRVARRSSRSGHQLDPRTSLAAGYLMVLTSLPASAQSAARVLELYRARWQVELSFKRLKTLGGIDALPSADPRLARTWLLAHLIVAVLTDELASQIVDFPPSQERRRSTARIALEGLGAGTPDPAARHHTRAAQATRTQLYAPHPTQVEK